MNMSLKALAGNIIGDESLDHQVGLQLDDFAVTVRSNSAALAARLRDYFREWVVDPTPHAVQLVALQSAEPDLGLEWTDWRRDPGKVGRKEAFCDVDGGRVILKVRTGMQFLIGREVHLGVGDCEANDNQIINFVIAQYITHLLARDALLCHSAGITHCGKGITIAATSGAGKSTLSLHLMGRGVNFVSNDRVLVNNDGGHVTMHGVPKQPRVNPGTLLNNEALSEILDPERAATLRAMTKAELWELEEKYDVDIERVYGPGRWQLASSLNALLVLNWSRKQPAPAKFARVDLRERLDLLQLIMKGPGPFYMTSHDGFLSGKEALDPQPYLQGLDAVPCYEASGGVDFEAGVQWCLKLLES